MPLNAIEERAKKYQPKPKITYKMIQKYVEKKYGFKVHTAYIAEVKRSLGFTMYGAPNAVEELKYLRKSPQKEKVEAITDALRWLKMCAAELCQKMNCHICWSIYWILHVMKKY